MVGAAVTTGVFLIALVSMGLLGFISFGRRKKSGSRVSGLSTLYALVGLIYVLFKRSSTEKLQDPESK